MPIDRSEKSNPSAAFARSIATRWRRTSAYRTTIRPVASESTIATGTSAKLSRSRASTGPAARNRTGQASPGSR